MEPVHVKETLSFLTEYIFWISKTKEMKDIISMVEGITIRLEKQT